MAGPGVYERRRAKRERQKMAEQLSDMPWERDPYSGRVTGRLVGETGDITRTPEDVERWGRSAGRTSPPGVRQPQSAAAPVPDVSITGMPEFQGWPAPPGGYGRWSNAGTPRQNWPDWYAPKGAVEDQPHLAVINQLLPYMNPDDVEALSGQLYIAGGGRGGPFSNYLRAGQVNRPVYGPPNRQPEAGWEQWVAQVQPQFPDKPWHQKWWAKRPLGGRVTDWENWWKNKPPGDWRNWFAGGQ